MEQALSPLKNVVFLSLLLLPHLCLSQSKAIERAKEIASFEVLKEELLCYDDWGWSGEEVFLKEISSYKITELKSKGFYSNDFLFFKIDIYPESDTTVPYIITPETFVFGANLKHLTVYRLKNFQRNEVSFLVEAMRSSDSKYKHLRNPRRFSQTYFVEGIDFECLLKGIRKKQTSDLAMRFPCLEHCLSIILVI